MSPAVIALVGIVVAVGMMLWGGTLADATDDEAEAFTAVGRTRRSLLFIGCTWAVGGLWFWLVIRAPVRRAALAIERTGSSS